MTDFITGQSSSLLPVQEGPKGIAAYIEWRSIGTGGNVHAYYIMLCYVVLCHVMLCYVMLCYVMLCYVMLCYVMLCYVMLCYVMLCYIMLCYVMIQSYMFCMTRRTLAVIS